MDNWLYEHSSCSNKPEQISNCELYAESDDGSSGGGVETQDGSTAIRKEVTVAIVGKSMLINFCFSFPVGVPKLG